MKTFKHLIIFIILLIGCSKQSHPTDFELIDNFNKNRELFIEMFMMIETDSKLKMVDDNRTFPDDHFQIGISYERISEYRKLLNKCKIPFGFSAFHKEEEIEFIASSFGIATGGSSKGYTYMKFQPVKNEIVGSIDCYKPNNSKNYHVYKHIEGNWYLFYDYDG